MTLDDIKKLATGSLLFSLDRIIAPRLINILYMLGLAGIIVWAITHFFATFGLGFGTGIWGLLEILVFGLLGFVGLRIICDALIVYFKANEAVVEAASQPKPSVSLIDEVRDAIEELAEEDKEPIAIDPPAKAPVKAAAKTTAKPAPKKTAAKAPRRTARRTPKPAGK